jgi:hypothetical protein
VASPMPLFPPVITTVFFSRRDIVILPYVRNQKVPNY